MPDTTEPEGTAAAARPALPANAGTRRRHPATDEPPFAGLRLLAARHVPMTDEERHAAVAALAALLIHGREHHHAGSSRA